MLCKHCEKRVGRKDQRNLCRVCYYLPGVRELFPVSSGRKPHKPHAKPFWTLDHEPTEEELDRCIDEQRPTMPVEVYDMEPDPIDAPQVVIRGLLARDPRVDRKKGRNNY